MGASVSIFNWGGGGVSEDEIMLGKPDDAEAKSLHLHVRKCALRYSIFTRRQAAQGSDIVQIKYMMWGLIGAFLITSQQARDMVEWFHKFIL